MVKETQKIAMIALIMFSRTNGTGTGIAFTYIWRQT